MQDSEEPWAVLQKLEGELRRVIVERLSTVTADWEERIPDAVRSKVQKRRSRAMEKGEEGKQILEYADFSDYHEILFFTNNWDDAFGTIFGDKEKTRLRLVELNRIRNAIAHRRDIDDDDRDIFLLYSRLVMSSMRKYMPDREIIAGNLKRYSESCAVAYEGAVIAAYKAPYQDQIAQFAHSLREAIDLLARSAQEESDRKKPLGRSKREALLQNAVGSSDFRMGVDHEVFALLADEYDRLSKIAHHGEKITLNDVQVLLSRVENALFTLTSPQTSIDHEIDDLIRRGPSRDGANRIAGMLTRRSTRAYLIKSLPASWLPHLVDAGAFGKTTDVQGHATPFRTDIFLSGYLVKCVEDDPDMVADIIESFDTDKREMDPTACLHFLECATRLPYGRAVTVATKAAREGWGRLVRHRQILPVYSGLIARLYGDAEYDLANNLAYDALKATVEGGGVETSLRIAPLEPGEFDYAVETILAEMVRKSPEEAAAVLISLLDSYAKHEKGLPIPLLSRQVSSIEDSNQNVMGGPLLPIVRQARDALQRLGDEDGNRLRNFMPKLYAKSGTLYRRIELHIYRQFPGMFESEAIASLNIYCGVDDAHHEYYKLLAAVFPRLGESDRKSLYRIIDEGCQGAGSGSEASARVKKLRLLSAIKGHMDNAHAAEYERLSREAPGMDHPDYLTYCSVDIDPSRRAPVTLRGLDVDSVIKAVSNTQNNDPLRMFEDSMADEFEDIVATNPDVYGLRAMDLAGARPAVQCALFAGLEQSVKKSDAGTAPAALDLASHLLSKDVGCPDTRPVYGQWNVPLRIGWYLNSLLVNGAIGLDYRNAAWRIVDALVNAGSIRAPYECTPGEALPGMDALNTVGGISFILLFRYAIWSRPNGTDARRLAPEVRSAIEAYMGEGTAHTTCRHSVLGVFFSASDYLAPGWLGDLISKAASSEDVKVAFWTSYVAHNGVAPESFKSLLRLYGEFLCGPLLTSSPRRTALADTFRHVAMAHFYNVAGADNILGRFLKSTQPVPVECAEAVAQIMAGKGDDPDFNKAKLAALWRHPKFAPLDLSDWFVVSPLERKETLDLFSRYLDNHEGRLDMMVAPLKDLGEYVAEFPQDVARCLFKITKRSALLHYPGVRDLLDTLDGLDNPLVHDLCNKTREELAVRGFDYDRDEKHASKPTSQISAQPTREPDTTKNILAKASA